MSVTALKSYSDYKVGSAAELTASEFLEKFRAKKISSLEYAQSCLDQIEKLNGSLAAFERFDRDQVETKAKEIDSDKNKWDLPFAGVLTGVKDNINTYDYSTERGTQILKEFTPGNDARVVSDIRLNGGVIAGKTVTAEFGVHHPGATVYPYDANRSPGTSSSGSAVAVASRMVPIALGTQTGGSIIRPASYCGIIGYKPSYGTVARTGVLKTTDTLDTVGFMARSVDDVFLTFEVSRVHGHNYPYVTKGLAKTQHVSSGESWRVCIVKGPKDSDIDPAVQDAFSSIIKDLGFTGVEIVEFTLPQIFGRAHDVHERIYSKALSYYLKEEWEWRSEAFSDVLTMMMKDGSEFSTETYLKDLQDQEMMGAVLDQALVEAGVDLIICPATSAEAPIGRMSQDVSDHNLIWTMCGNPVITLPLMRGNDGLPVGVSVVARKYGDYLIKDFANFVVEALSV